MLLKLKIKEGRGSYTCIRQNRLSVKTCSKRQKRSLGYLGYLPDQILMQRKEAYSGKIMPQRTFISKEEKQALGFKAGYSIWYQCIWVYDQDCLYL